MNNRVRDKYSEVMMVATELSPRERQSIGRVVEILAAEQQELEADADSGEAVADVFVARSSLGSGSATSMRREAP